MTVNEAREAKSKLQLDVNDLFDKFELATGLCVVGCIVRNIQTSTADIPWSTHLVSVNVELESI